MGVLEHMEDICDFIDLRLGVITSMKPHDAIAAARGFGPRARGNVLVHSNLDPSFSKLVLMAYMMRRDDLKVEQVLSQMRTKIRVQPNLTVERILRMWRSLRFEVWKDMHRLEFSDHFKHQMWME